MHAVLLFLVLMAKAHPRGWEIGETTKNFEDSSTDLTAQPNVKEYLHGEISGAS